MRQSVFPWQFPRLENLGAIIYFVNSGKKEIEKGKFFVQWFENHGRLFSWRSEKTTPYQFLVTEMLVRQTRAGAVEGVWNGLFQNYPDIFSLAAANPVELNRQLKILGFANQRTEALISAASWIIEKHNGLVPPKLDDLLKVPHIGNYAARAILCFAFGEKIEIVDTNILRFFARYYDLEVKPDIRRNPMIWTLAANILPTSKKKTREHNYGLLDFTAQICKPGKPLCYKCPLVTSCSYKYKNLEVKVK
jgi:A/G-specific adenine glycosylase